MNSADDVLDRVIADLDKVRALLRRSDSPQVRSEAELTAIKSLCTSWFGPFRATLATAIGDDLVGDLDGSFRELRGFMDRRTSRAIYSKRLEELRRQFRELRPYTVGLNGVGRERTEDSPPDFSSLVGDEMMRGILRRRWGECVRCVEAGAPLAATVVMGGLLEALLLTRVLSEPDKKRVFATKSVPKDKTSGTPLPFKEWTLRHFIDVAHELQWISHSAKDVGEVLRDYRNYIHPEKERSHGIVLEDRDATLIWEVSKGIARQLLR